MMDDGMDVMIIEADSDLLTDLNLIDNGYG